MPRVPRYEHGEVTWSADGFRLDAYDGALERWVPLLEMSPLHTAAMASLLRFTDFYWLSVPGRVWDELVAVGVAMMDEGGCYPTPLAEAYPRAAGRARETGFGPVVRPSDPADPDPCSRPGKPPGADPVLEPF